MRQPDTAARSRRDRPAGGANRTIAQPITTILVVGARPNFVKVMPVWREMRRFPSIFNPLIIHTGQHYGREMSDRFFEELGLPDPDVSLAVGSGSHAVQTAAIMTAFEKVLLERKIDLVVVFGDVNSTLACSLVAVKMGIRVAHVEAGLRSFDRRMPEELNRILTDRLSDLLFTSCPEAERNLLREGAMPDSIFPVGNVMIDSLKLMLPKSRKSGILPQLGLRKNRYAVLTLHRPATVDDPTVFARVLSTVCGIGDRIPIVFPVHPRTRKRMAEWGLHPRGNGVRLTEPLGYLDFLRLCSCAQMLMTDSGGIQEETSYLGIPCLTLRENTERPVTVTHGTNKLVGTDPARIRIEALRILNGRFKKGRIPRLWDGKAAVRIVRALRRSA